MRVLRGRRRLLIWLCLAAMLCMGLAAQRHGLAHVLKVLSTAAHQDSAPLHTQGCEQCLQFAAFDAAVPVSPALPLVSVQQASHRAVVALPSRAEPFVDYESRAPPRTA